MKKIIALLITAVLILALASCSAGNTAGQTATNSDEAVTESASTKAPEATKSDDKTTTDNNDKDNSGKALVTYFSATGTTKGVAEQIADVTGADIYEITAAKPYTSEDLDYNDSNSRATKEQNDKAVRPEISGKKINTGDYDTIYIGFPIWWGEEPRIMDTFVESYDFSGKTVIPFCTSGSSPIDTAEDNLKANAGCGEWKDGKRFSAETTSKDIETWIKTL